MLAEIGTYKQGFSGIQALDWVDIKAYADLMGIDLTAEEVRLLKKLSEDYVNQFYKSKDQFANSPYTDENEHANSIDNLFNAF